MALNVYIRNTLVVASIVAAGYVGFRVAKAIYDPIRVHMADINGDDFTDVVLVSGTNSKQVFLNDKRGSYPITLDKFLDDKLKAVDEFNH